MHRIIKSLIFVGVASLLAACSPASSPTATHAPAVASATSALDPTAISTATNAPTALPEPTDMPTATQAPAPTSEPTAPFVPLPNGPFSDSGDAFVLGPFADNDWETQMIFTAGVVAYEGLYYQYYTGIGANWPQRVGMSVATSNDGLTWERTADVPLLTAEGIGFAVQKSWVPLPWFR